MFRFKALVFAAMMVVLFCSAASVEPQQKSGAIMPLSVGNYWKYIQTKYIDDRVESVDTLTYIVEKDTTIGSDKWSIVKITEGSHKTFRVPFKVDREGLWVVLTVPGLKEEPVLMLKYPTTVGDSWLSGYKTKNDTTRTVGMNVRETTPFGEFECIEYHSNDNNTLYVKPGIGIVKTKRVYSQYSMKIVELIDYKIKS